MLRLQHAIGFVSLCIVFASASSAPGQIQIRRHTIDGGGVVAAAADTLELSATIGQPDAGPGTTGMSGGTLTLTGGFWIAQVVCPGDTNGDLVVDLTDLANVLADYGMIGPGLAGDIDGDLDVDLTDLAIVIGNFNLNC